MREGNERKKQQDSWKQKMKTEAEFLIFGDHTCRESNRLKRIPQVTSEEKKLLT